MGEGGGIEKIVVKILLCIEFLLYIRFIIKVNFMFIFFFGF